MVRTAATSVKTSGGKSAKASRNSGVTNNSYSSSSDKNTIGGNPVCHRETPVWQKPITKFFTKHDNEKVNTFTSEETEKRIDETLAENETNLGEGSSKMLCITETDQSEKTIEDTSMNKENIENNMKDKVTKKSDNEKTKEQSNIFDKNINTDVPAKKQKLDFYKHLEEIENNLN